MSFSDAAPSAVAIRRALTVLVVGAIAATVAVLAPLGNTDRADARSPQVTSAETVHSQAQTVISASLWSPERSILVFPSSGAAGVTARPLIALPSDSAAVAGGFASEGFLSERARSVDALARVVATLKAEHDAVVAAATSAAAAAAVAAQAAAVAAAQAAAQAVAQAAANAAARAAQGFVQRVWTSGFQNEINQCRGAVDVTGVYQVRVIAEHSSCGGNRFPTTPGATVTITGLDAGRYRVIGVVAHLNGLVNHAEDIPRGYDLLFQTCAAGFTDMRFTALERIG
jgi:hypothetical protein